MLLEPLKRRETAVEQCARALRGAILDGSVAVGARLPPERRLAEELGVNRVTLRGALLQLTSRGLLSVRQGSGYVVRDYRRAGGPDLVAALAELASAKERHVIVADLLAVRRALARVVLERIDPTMRPSIEAAVDRFEEVASRPAEIDEVADADLDVLEAILDATKSPVLGLFFNPVFRVVEQLGPLRRAMYAAPETNVAGYRVLVAWLGAKERPPVDVVIAELERRDRITVEHIRSEA